MGNNLLETQQRTTKRMREWMRLEDRHNDDRKEHETDCERRRSRRRSSRSRTDVPESVQKELREVSVMIHRISGVPKLLGRATPTTYADSPFCENPETIYSAGAKELVRITPQALSHVIITLSFFNYLQ